MIVDSRLLSQLKRFFPQSVTIQQNTNATADSLGQPNVTWANLASHVDLDCQLSPTGGAEFRDGEQVYSLTTHKIIIRGAYTAIRPAMRAVIGGVAYDILKAGTDSQLVTTHLDCRVVTE